MPLQLPGPPAQSKAVSHDDRQAIGFWMTGANVQWIKPVRMFVPYWLLSELDPAQFRDLQGAFAIFEANRRRIELAASAQFDSLGPDEEGDYQGQLVVTLKLPDRRGRRGSPSKASDLRVSTGPVIAGLSVARLAGAGSREATVEGRSNSIGRNPSRLDPNGAVSAFPQSGDGLR